MTTQLHVALAGVAEARAQLRELLSQLGHRITEVHDGQAPAGPCRDATPDLVIADVDSEADGIDAAEAACRGREVPLILVSGRPDAELLAWAVGGPALAYLVKPLSAAQLEAAIAVARARCAEHRAVREELGQLRQALEDRKVIERAKGAVMKRLSMDEEEAYRLLQRTASNHNRKLAELAQQVLAAEEVFRKLA